MRSCAFFLGFAASQLAEYSIPPVSARFSSWRLRTNFVVTSACLVVTPALAPADCDDEPWLRVDPCPAQPPSFPALPCSCLPARPMRLRRAMALARVRLLLWPSALCPWRTRSCLLMRKFGCVAPPPGSRYRVSSTDSPILRGADSEGGSCREKTENGMTISAMPVFDQKMYTARGVAGRGKYNAQTSSQGLPAGQTQDIQPSVSEFRVLDASVSHSIRSDAEVESIMLGGAPP